MNLRRSAVLWCADIARHTALCVSGASLGALAGCAGHSVLRNEDVRIVREAGYHDPMMRVELAHGPGYYLANENREPRALYGNPRRYLIVDVGYPTPVLALSNRKLARSAFVPYEACDETSGTPGMPDDWRCQGTVQFTIPVAFYLFWDPFTENNPIINTDYTFGFDLSGRIALWKGTEQRAGIYWGHISTHIGDEYTISARRVPGARFPRINVSYFPWRANLGNRWYYGGPLPGSVAMSYVQLAAEVEGPCLPWVCGASSYYDIYPTETQGVAIPLIPPGHEFTGTLDWRRVVDWRHPNAVPTSVTTEPTSLKFGLLVGNRRIFPYLNPHPERRYGIAVNGTVGFEFPTAAGFGASSAEIYLRGYSGPNPYGQLRNQSHFSLVGLGMKLR